MKTWVAEVGFHAKPSTIFSPESDQSWYYSLARCEALLSCLQASKDYLDYFLTLSSEVVLGYTLPEYIRLVYTVLILVRFTTGCDSPLLNDENMRESADLPRYLDALIRKFNTMITYQDSEEVRNYIWRLRSLFKMYKTVYNQEELSKMYGILKEADGSDSNFPSIMSSLVGECKVSGSMIPINDLAGYPTTAI